MNAALQIGKNYKSTSTDLQDEAIISLLAKKDERAFEQVFKTYFKSLHGYVCSILKEDIYAEEIVQQVFFKLWERAENLSISDSIGAYLYRAVYNESLNHLKHEKVKSKHKMHVAYSMQQSAESASKALQAKELEKKIHAALNELPEQCRTVFQMSRNEEMKYREIAEELNIAVKTVENQMGKALKILREKLAEFLTLAFLLLNILK